jgi:hypothetical protein
MGGTCSLRGEFEIAHKMLGAYLKLKRSWCSGKEYLVGIYVNRVAQYVIDLRIQIRVTQTRNSTDTQRFCT